MSAKKRSMPPLSPRSPRSGRPALGRTEARLKTTLEAIRRFDAGELKGKQRERLLSEASEACLGYVVQREAMGLPTADDPKRLWRDG